MEFSGQRPRLESFLKSIDGAYYVYELCRPDGRPFYVGKGIRRRVIEHELEAMRHHPAGETNPFKCNVIRQIRRKGEEITYNIVRSFPPEDEYACLKLETDLIVRYGRRHEGGCLTNLAGGMGAQSGASPFSLERHAATLSGEPDGNPDRTVLNRFLQGIGPVASVPIKPASQIKHILPTTPHPSPRKPTARCAYALAASATAHGIPFNKAAKIPRAFEYEGILGVIENGVARDILKAGMATLAADTAPIDEVFVLDDDQVAQVISLIGSDRLHAIGLL